MAEILTESFCERCGTRYTFESPARRTSPLGALGTVGRGLRNFVASGDQSIDEAFAVARAENEQKATAHQLEAFHRTFNFCLSCRQYTCGSCWNPVEGRCQSCAPMPEAEMLPAGEVGADAPVVAEAMAIARAAAIPVIDAPGSIETEIGADAPEAEAGIDELASADILRRLDVEPEAPEAETVDVSETFASLAVEDLDVPVASEPEPETPTEAIGEPAAEAEPETAVVVEPEPPVAPEPEPGATTEPDATSGTRRRPSGLPAFPPGVSLDEEIAAYDLRVAALADPPTAVAPTPSPAPAAMPMPIAAPAPDELRPAAVRSDVSSPSADAAVAPRMAAEPALPPVYVAGAVPELPAASPAALPAAQTTGTCGSCGLSLSATARFCRRCGTPQPVA